MNPKVDFFFSRAGKWKDEFGKLRMIVLDCGLTEELKWGCPCYTSEGRNVVLIHGFKDYCALLFFKGALLNDEYSILVQQTKNVQAARQVRFRSAQEISRRKSILKAYVRQAVAAEKAGLKVKRKSPEVSIPEEFQARLTEEPALKSAFYALTPGRQRGYLLFFSAARQSKTRAARVEKYRRHILEGKGLDD